MIILSIFSAYSAVDSLRDKLQTTIAYQQIQKSYELAIRNGRAIRDIDSASRVIGLTLNDAKTTIYTAQLQVVKNLDTVSRRVVELGDPVPSILKISLYSHAAISNEIFPYLKRELDIDRNGDFALDISEIIQRRHEKFENVNIANTTLGMLLIVFGPNGQMLKYESDLLNLYPFSYKAALDEVNGSEGVFILYDPRKQIVTYVVRTGLHYRGMISSPRWKPGPRSNYLRSTGIVTYRCPAIACSRLDSASIIINLDGMSPMIRRLNGRRPGVFDIPEFSL